MRAGRRCSSIVAGSVISTHPAAIRGGRAVASRRGDRGTSLTPRPTRPGPHGHRPPPAPHRPRLLRIAWDTVGRIVERVVADHLDERRLEGLVAIGVEAIRNAIPAAEVAFDPFHVVRLAQRAVDQVRRDEWNAHERSHTPKGRWIKNTRWSLLKAPAKQSGEQLARLHEVQHANKALYRAFLLKEELRLLYQLQDPTLPPPHLDAWLAWASRSRLEPFIKLARTIRRHRDGILAAIRLRLTNGRLEGLNSRIRLISHRSFGFHSAAPLIALVYLCCTGIVNDLPR